MAREDTPLLLDSGDAKEEDAQEISSIIDDAIDTLHLAAPIFISRLSASLLDNVLELKPGIGTGIFEDILLCTGDDIDWCNGLLSNVTFLSAQRIMRPEVTTSMIALGFNLLLGSIFVLGFPIPGFDGLGFKACPIVTVTVVWIQSIVLWTFFRDILKKDSSFSISKRDGAVQKHNFISSMIDGITLDRICTFSALYFPAALSSASDFWRMGLIGTVAATLGEREVGLFNASYRILWIR
ncbi:hypothetical protein QTG54_004480 [Skeletonema marinoi]|uniref:Uncharacterized protein n=1 Tax=Skeletonema marinoi TaxID=267567 RepID=A0AAD8YGN0_9STRA|nr:hypothetical protein QTG54_004480 [Skeletonema marinoi]